MSESNPNRDAVKARAKHLAEAGVKRASSSNGNCEAEAIALAIAANELAAAQIAVEQAQAVFDALREALERCLQGNGS